MKIYAKVNSSAQTIDESNNPICPDGYIEMKEQRPDIDYIAQADGTWLYVEPVQETAPITKRQAMLQLNSVGLYDDLIDFINKTENKTLKIEFEYSAIFERNSSFIVGMASYFELSDEQVDDLFIEASKL